MRAIFARVSRLGDLITVSYTIEGDLSRLRAAPTPGEPLWKHSCCELFIATKGFSGYREFNFSLCGERAAYAFEGYRQRISFPKAGIAPRVAIRTSSQVLELDATVSASGSLKIGLSAVMEDKDQGLSYWALRHPPGAPDFHHPDAFALESDAVRN